ncbi:hypothetical protein OH805_21215 [Streptomyces sp. NBC_00879]|uniref:DUF6197 family protein n=1 Tax=Streptomyces sp. NBC_00879 TaxID=2975855 RepID=UPI00386BF661|nr:hypothetical protein OH805_21215 [Streptomyces sp. NBC_00879]
MTTATAARATRISDIAVDADRLVAEIEQYLAASTRATAHPLVTKTTSELVAEALAGLDTPQAPAAKAPQLTPPSALLRRLPEWVLSLPLLRAWHGGGRPITAAEHLELTALVIERFGWARGTERGSDGQRCLIGAQYALTRLGYGDIATVHTASTVLQDTLGHAAGSYVVWNDHPARTRDQVLTLVRTAAATARSAGR